MHPGSTPDTPNSNEHTAASADEEDAVACVSVSRDAPECCSTSANQVPQDVHSVQWQSMPDCHPAGPTGQQECGVCDRTDSSTTPLTPRTWYTRMFDKPQQQQQGRESETLILDGQELVWDPTGQEDEQQQQGASTEYGFSSTCRRRATANYPHRCSLSSPNLTLFASSSGSVSCNLSSSIKQQPGQQPQWLAPMPSSSSCDCLLNLAAPPALGPIGSASGTGPAKSRLGRVTASTAPDAADVAPPAGWVQQQAVSPAPPDKVLDSCSGCWEQQQQAEPMLSSWAGAGINNWTFSRCNSSCSLGSERFGRRLRVHCVTFNMSSKLPDRLPSSLLGDVDAAGTEPVDLFVFATQENSNISEWERMLSAALSAGGYERLAWQALRAMHLVLFARRRFRRLVVSIRGCTVATGIGNLVGNKGAVALSVELVDLKLLFVDSHFAAHDDQVQQRNADYQRIKAGLFAGPSTPSSQQAGASTTASGANTPRRRSLQLPREPQSAPAGSSSGHWSGFLKSNRVADASSPHGSGLATSSNVRPAQKRVAWWVDPSPEPPACTSAPTSATPGALGSTLQQDALTQQLERLRVASCPSVGTSHQLTAEFGANGSQAALSTAESGSPVAVAGNVKSAGLVAQAPGSQSNSFLKLGGLMQPLKAVATTRTSSGEPASGDVLEQHDAVFWLGDLNYRINGNAHAVRYLMRSRLTEVLHANDQLRLQQKKGAVFQGFEEGRIRFPPTFKFLPGTNEYSDQRVPSWTDRVLWKVRSPQQQPTPSWPGVPAAADSYDGLDDWSLPPSVTQLYYTSIPEVISSDHKPVVAGFDIMAEGEDDMYSEQGDSEQTTKRSRCCMM